MPPTLDVWCFGELAGSLIDAPDGLMFEYASSWTDAAQPPLSQSLPVSGGFGSQAVHAFFGGLLPEGEPRALLARQLGVSVANDFGLLAELGGDTAGAVSVTRPGGPPPHPDGDVTWLDDAALADEIDELPQRPMHADEEGEYRLSLAGAQDKLPVVVAADGRVGLTKGGTPSTHILKTPIARLSDTVFNEAACLALGQALGVQTAQADPRRVMGREYLLVKRYDRLEADGEIRRLHQEDFCQALGVPSSRKYQAEGGPGFTDLFAMLRAAVAVPARDAIRLLDQIVLSFVVGNHDAHGKNFSLLYAAGSTRATLAPAYDVVSTVVYRKAQPMSRRMAMSIGGENRPDYVRARHLDALLEEAGLAIAAGRRRVRELAQRAPDAARLTVDQLSERGWQPPLAGELLDVVAQRARWLGEIAA
jgi:serine/threonine-protein kinase HipA